MGDSLTDGSVSGGERWPEFMQSERGLDFGGPGEPYNVAVSGAPATLLWATGQTAQMVRLVRDGSVDVPILWAGGTEMLAFSAQIASGWEPEPYEQFKVGLVDGILRTVDRVLDEGPAGFILANVPDLSDTPFAAEYDAQGRANLARAADEVNALLRREAASRPVVWVDLTGALRAIFDQGAVLGGVPLDLTGQGVGDPLVFFRDLVHPAVPGNVLIVAAFVEALNRGFGTSFAPFTDLEIMTVAGIDPLYQGETLAPVVDVRRFVEVLGPIFRNDFESGNPEGWSTCVGCAPRGG